MAVSYKKLWDLLKEKKITKADLRIAANISSNTLTRMRKNEPVTLDLLSRVCEILEVDFGDIVSYIPTNRKQTALTDSQFDDIQEETNCLCRSYKNEYSKLDKETVFGDLIKSTDKLSHVRKDLLLLNEYLLMNRYKKDGAPDYIRFRDDADISQSTWSNYYNASHTKGPQKTLLKIILALRMPTDDAVKFMTYSGAGFYPNNFRDMLVLAFINKNYLELTDVSDIQHAVFDLIRYCSKKKPNLENLYDF